MQTNLLEITQVKIAKMFLKYELIYKQIVAYSYNRIICNKNEQISNTGNSKNLKILFWAKTREKDTYYMISFI